MDSSLRVADEPERQIALLLDGQLGDVEAENLAGQLASNEELRVAYVRYARVHAMLGWCHGAIGKTSYGEVDPVAMAELLEEAEQATRRREAEEAAVMAAEEALAAERQRKLEREERHNRRRPEPIVIPYSVAYLGAVAFAASMLWIAFTLLPAGDAEVASSKLSPEVASVPLVVTPLVATVVDSTAAELTVVTGDEGEEKQRAISPMAGTRLAAGRYELTHGVVELEFNSGASVVVEAPATIILDSADRLQLLRGRLVGMVPPEAIGFTVMTSTATIVDLGTEFGVSVPEAHNADTQATDISVFNGEVEVVTVSSADQQAPQRQRLLVNTSVRVDNAGSFATSETNTHRYFRDVPDTKELQQKIAYERWLTYSKKLAADPDMVAYYTFNDQQLGDTQLFDRAIDGPLLHGDIQGAQWVEGRWPHKQALRFANSNPLSDSNHFVQVDIPGRFDVLTLAAWVNVDAMAEGYSALLVSDGWSRVGQVHWQLTKDGRNHIGLYDSPDIIKRDADMPLQANRFGKWHHMAVVCSTHTQQTTFYIDGKPAGTKDMRASQEMFFGPSRIGGWKPEASEDGFTVDDWETLRGRMDELVIIGRTLDKQEIQSMYEAGRP